jgi:hypothetical protein
MKRILLPIILAVLGATLLIGCFYLPVVPHPQGNAKQDKVFEDVGNRSSKEALLVGKATRQQVLSIAPIPMMASDDGKSLLYSTEGTKGYWVYPLCFMASPQLEELQIRLNFDDAGVLQSYKISRGGFDETFSDLKPRHYYLWGGGARPWPPPIATSQPSHVPLH